MRTQKFLVAGAAALALTLSACAPNAAAPAPAPGTAGSTDGAAAPADTASRCEPVLTLPEQRVSDTRSPSLAERRVPTGFVASLRPAATGSSENC